MKLLFLCVANSARSQMAEGLAKHIFGPQAEIQSAGSLPTQLNPFAVKVMKEIGIDISSQLSKGTDQIDSRFLENADCVITLCAEEVCPIMLAKEKRVHWQIPDPVRVSETEEQQLERFRSARDRIQSKLEELDTAMTAYRQTSRSYFWANLASKVGALQDPDDSK